MFFSNLFHIPFRTSFCDFFTDFRVAKPPVLELVGSIFRQQKNESKNGMRVYATACDRWRGGIPLNKITIPAETAFQHQFTPAVPEGTVADSDHSGGLKKINMTSHILFIERTFPVFSMGTLRYIRAGVEVGMLRGRGTT